MTTRLAIVPFFTLLLTARDFAAEMSPPPHAKSTVLIFCGSTDASTQDAAADSWREPLVTVGLRLAKLYETNGVSVVVGESAARFCPRFEDSACTVEALTPTIVYCDGEILSRTIQASAYMSMAAAVTVLADENSKGKVKPRLPIDAFNAYDSVYASRFLPPDRVAVATNRIHEATGIPFSEMEPLGRAMGALAEDEAWGISPQRPTTRVVGVARSIYDVATQELLAFVIGHEVAHTQGDCPFSQHSTVENSGLVADLINVQLERKLGPLSLSEVRADVCATRTVQTFSTESVPGAERSELSPAVDATPILGRRIAIDLAGWLLSRGLRADANINTHKLTPLSKVERMLYYQDRPTEGYLRTPFRLLLLAKTLHNLTGADDTFVDACDERFDWSLAYLTMDCDECKDPPPRADPRLAKWLPTCGPQPKRWDTELGPSSPGKPPPPDTLPNLWPKNAAVFLPDGQPIHVTRALGELLAAVKDDDVDGLRQQLKVHRDLARSVLPFDGDSILHWTAAHQADSKIVEMLLDAGAVSTSNWKGQTPLLLAAYGEHPNTVRLLVNRTADLNTHDVTGTTPLMAALGSAVPESVNILLETGASVTGRNRIGNFALMIAVGRSTADTVHKILAKGADPNQALPDGNAPIHFAVMADHDDMVDVLLQAGANADSRTGIGKTPLHFAAMLGRTAAMELLLMHSANIDLTDLEGCTPLLFAALLGNRDVVETLVRHGANRDIPNSTGLTPLLAAIEQDHADLAELLVTKQSATQPDAHGSTPLQIAVAKNNPTLVKLLRRYGAQ